MNHKCSTCAHYPLKPATNYAGTISMARLSVVDDHDKHTDVVDGNARVKSTNNSSPKHLKPYDLMLEASTP